MTLNFWPQSYETPHFCCFKPPGCEILCQQPGKTEAPASDSK